jgi:hypothetical protein
MSQGMLAISPPDLRPVDARALLATEYTPLAPGVRWVALDDVGVVMPVPKSWTLRSGVGRLLGVPLRTHVASWDPEEAGEAMARRVAVAAGAVRPPDALGRARGPRWRSSLSSGASGAPGSSGGGGDGGGGGGDSPDGDSDDDDGDGAFDAEPVPGGTPADARAQNPLVGMVVTCYRGAFGSPLLAGTHGSPLAVARFFSQLHVMRRSPPGLVRGASVFKPDGDGDGGNDDDEGGEGGGGGGRIGSGVDIDALRGAMLGGGGTGGGSGDLLGGGTGTAAGTGGALAGEAHRRPDVLAAWHREMPRSEAMPGVFDGIEAAKAAAAAAAASTSTNGGAAAGAAAAALAAARRRLDIVIPRAWGPATVLGGLLGGTGGGGGGGSGGSGGGSGGGSFDADPLTGDDADDISGLDGRDPTGDSPGGGPRAPRITARLAPEDPVHVYGIDYVLRANAFNTSEEGRGVAAAAAAAAGAAPSPSSSSSPLAPGAPSSPSSLAGTLGDGMRYNLTLVLDPVGDTVTEVTFTAPAALWPLLWEHDMVPAGSGGPESHAALERAAEGKFLRAVGLGSLPARDLMDSVTVRGVPDEAAHWRFK